MSNNEHNDFLSVEKENKELNSGLAHETGAGNNIERPVPDTKILVNTRTKSSIVTKLTFYVTLLIFCIMTVTSIYVARQQEVFLVEQMIDKAENQNKNLLTSFKDAIISNQITILQGSIEEVKKNDAAVEVCEIYDEDKFCIASTNEDNRGKQKLNDIVDLTMQKRSTNKSFSENKQSLKVAVPLIIGNTLKGSLYIQYSLKKMHDEIAASYLKSAMICLIAIIVGWIISLFFSRKFTGPVFDLANGANEILKGNYDYKITKISDDETGLISIAFNSVTESLTQKIKELSEYSENLARTNRELDKKINELKSLQELGKVISSIFNLEELLRAIIQNATIVMKSKRCSIILVHEKTGEFYIKVAKGLNDNENFMENIKLASGGFVTDYCVKQKLPLLVTDADNDDRIHKGAKKVEKSAAEQNQDKNTGDEKKYKTKSFIAVPLVVNDRVIGVISITEKHNDELYNESDLQLLQIFANQVVIAIENAKLYERLVVKEKLERELEIAHNIQMNMLPQKYPEIKGVSIAGTSFPAKEVGGDYYDFLPVSESKVGITIGDVSGKGVPAALMMVMIRSILRAKVMSNNNPKDIVLELNNLILNELEPRMFITLFYTVLDAENKLLKYTNAGHNYPMIFHCDNEEVESLKDGGLLLGVFESPVYEEGTYQLRNGDVVVMYTDGIVEAMNVNDEMFGYEKMCEIVHENKFKNAADIKEAIMKQMQEFVGDAPQYDDLTLIVIKIDDSCC
ncbi:MAG: SpoIIE family protein phosphatase [Candidatus Wallbacteria bacterium]